MPGELKVGGGPEGRRPVTKAFADVTVEDGEKTRSFVIGHLRFINCHWSLSFGVWFLGVGLVRFGGLFELRNIKFFDGRRYGIRQTKSQPTTKANVSTLKDQIPKLKRPMTIDKFQGTNDSFTAKAATSPLFFGLPDLDELELHLQMGIAYVFES